MFNFRVKNLFLTLIIILLCLCPACKSIDNNLAYVDTNAAVNDNTYQGTNNKNNDTNINANNILLNNKKTKHINISTDNEIKLLFSGDILISKKTRDAYDNRGIQGILNKNYTNLIDSHDAFIGNIECVLSNIGYAENKQWTFNASPSYVRILKDVKYDLLTVANNHTLDYGAEAFVDMLKVLNNAGISYVGGGVDYEDATKPFIFEAGGKKIAIMATTIVLPDTSWVASGSNAGLNGGYQKMNILKQISETKKNVDKVVVFAHWGVEKEEEANLTQKLMAHAFVDKGADLVLGCHSHTIQNIEYYKGVPIFYSLGNFIYGSTDTDTALLSATFDFNEGTESDLKVKLIPGISFYEISKAFNKQQRIEYMKKLIEKSIGCYYDEDTENIYDLIKYIKNIEAEANDE